jgi:hypothetical protein
MEEQKGFFGALFDFSFTEFVTTRIIKVLFAIAIIGSAIVAIVYIAASFSSSTGLGILVLLLSPVIFIVYVILARVWLEVIIVLFRIAEHVSEIAKKK